MVPPPLISYGPYDSVLMRSSGDPVSGNGHRTCVRVLTLGAEQRSKGSANVHEFVAEQWLVAEDARINQTPKMAGFLEQMIEGADSKAVVRCADCQALPVFQ